MVLHLTRHPAGALTEWWLGSVGSLWVPPVPQVRVRQQVVYGRRRGLQVLGAAAGQASRRCADRVVARQCEQPVSAPGVESVGRQ